MKKIRFIILIGYLSSGASVATAGDNVTTENIATITKAWVCKWCPKPEPNKTKAYVNGKLGSVSNDSFQHGDYNGLHEKGVYGSVDADVRVGSENADQLRILASDVGLEAQKIELSGGQQGQYSGEIKYQQIPKYGTDTARTPFVGDSNKVLPVGWQSGATTVDFSTLQSDLHDEDIQTRRDTLSFAARYYQSAKISYDLSYSQDSKEGNRAVGVGLGNVFALARAVILPVPIEYETDRIKASAHYINGPMTASLSVERSNFNNLNESVQWQNPFSEPAAVSSGQISLEPDNSAHSLSLAGSYKLSSVTMATGHLSIGKMVQDNQYLPYTINTNLTTSSLPRTSLDGKINTLNGSFTINSRMADKLTLYAKYAYQEQDNDTARASYEYVTADTSVNSITRANFPYSFRKQTLDLKARYPLRVESVVTSGFNIQQHDRTYQEITRSREVAIWGKFKTQIGDFADTSLRLDLSERKGDTYVAISEIIPAENPLLRKYNLADRDRNKLNLNFSYVPSEKFNVNVSIDYLKDDFSNSELGLLDASEIDASVDLDYTFSRKMTAGGFISTASLDSSQKANTWSAENSEHFDIFGVSVKYDFIPDKFSLKFNYVNAQSKGETSLFSSAGGVFPDVVVDRQTFDISGDYKMKPKFIISVFFRYEKYEENDWRIDSVVANTIPNVLTLGEQSPSYDIGVFAVGLKYEF